MRQGGRCGKTCATRSACHGRHADYRRAPATRSRGRPRPVDALGRYSLTGILLLLLFLSLGNLIWGVTLASLLDRLEERTADKSAGWLLRFTGLDESASVDKGVTSHPLRQTPPQLATVSDGQKSRLRKYMRKTFGGLSPMTAEYRADPVGPGWRV